MPDQQENDLLVCIGVEVHAPVVIFMSIFEICRSYPNYCIIFSLMKQSLFFIEKHKFVFTSLTM
jgi:hypothetical protein